MYHWNHASEYPNTDNSIWDPALLKVPDDDASAVADRHQEFPLPERFIWPNEIAQDECTWDSAMLEVPDDDSARASADQHHGFLPEQFIWPNEIAQDVYTWDPATIKFPDDTTGAAIDWYHGSLPEQGPSPSEIAQNQIIWHSTLKVPHDAASATADPHEDSISSLERFIWPSEIAKTIRLQNERAEIQKRLATSPLPAPLARKARPGPPLDLKAWERYEFEESSPSPLDLLSQPKQTRPSTQQMRQ